MIDSNPTPNGPHGRTDSSRELALRLWGQADRRTTTVLLSSVVLMTVYVYQGTPPFYDRVFPAGPLQVPLLGPIPAQTLRQLYRFAAAFTLFGLIPALLVRWPMGQRLRDHGFCLGDWRFGLKTVLLGAPILVPFLYLGATQAGLRAEYPMSRVAGASVSHFLLYELSYGLYYFGWEFFFRGYMLFGLRERCGDLTAILIQTVPSTILHIGKPNVETAGAIVAGLAFGFVALRSRSVIYLVLLHWFIGACTDVFCLMLTP